MTIENPICQTSSHIAIVIVMKYKKTCHPRRWRPTAFAGAGFAGVNKARESLKTSVIPTITAITKVLVFSQGLFSSEIWKSKRLMQLLPFVATHPSDKEKS